MAANKPGASVRCSSAVVGASCFGICDARLGASRAAQKALPSAVGCRVAAWVGSVVLVELALRMACHLAEDPESKIAVGPWKRLG